MCSSADSPLPAAACASSNSTLDLVTPKPRRCWHACVPPLGQLLFAASRGEIAEDTRLEWDPRTAVDVVMAAENYPGTPRKGDAIAGLESASAVPDVHVVHAGTAVAGEEIVTAGGRVLAVVALGDTLAQARDAAYEGGTSHHLGRRTIPHRYRPESGAGGDYRARTPRLTAAGHPRYLVRHPTWCPDRALPRLSEGDRQRTQTPVTSFF